MKTSMKTVDLRQSESIGITTHALEKLRERLPAGSPWSSATDQELRSVMAKVWKQSRLSELVEQWYERVDGELVCNYIVDLSPDFGGELLGLVRGDDRTPGRPCFITVVTLAMAERSRGLNRWARSPEKVGSPVLLGNNMQEKLMAMTPADAVPYNAPLLAKMVVTWRTAQGEQRFQAIPKDSVGTFVSQLIHDGIEESTIEFWVRAQARISRKVSVDFE